MRKLLDSFYLLCGSLSALSLLLMVLLVAAQIVARFFDSHIPSSDDVSGYMTAWTTFLGLSYAMHKDDHIRVDLFLNFLPSRLKYLFYLTVTTTGLILLMTFLYYAFLSVKEAYEYGDVTTGLIPFPLWIIQVPFVFGIGALNISIVDRLIMLILFGTPQEKNTGNGDELKVSPNKEI